MVNVQTGTNDSGIQNNLKTACTVHCDTHAKDIIENLENDNNNLCKYLKTLMWLYQTVAIKYTHNMN